MRTLNNLKSIEKFKKAKEDYEEALNEVKNKSLREVIQEIGENIGNFAVVFIGYTPRFNDGDLIEHSSDYVFPTTYSQSSWNERYWCWDGDKNDRLDDDEYRDFFEVEGENNDLKCINSSIENVNEVDQLMSLLLDLVDDIYDTDFEVKMKYVDGDIIFTVDDYDCGY